MSVSGPVPDKAVATILALSCYAVLGAALGALGIALLLLKLRDTSPRAARAALDGLLLLALPGAAAAATILARSTLPHGTPQTLGLRWILPCCLLPLSAVPLMWRLQALPPGQARAARGLGAGFWQSVRLVWLPQLAPALLAGATAAAMPTCWLLGRLLLERR